MTRVIMVTNKDTTKVMIKVSIMVMILATVDFDL